MSALMIVLAVIVLIAWLPLGCAASYDGSPRIDVRVGPVRFTVVPGKDKPKKKKKPKKEKPKKETKAKETAGEKKEKKKITLSQIRQFIPMVQTALRAVRRLLKAIAFTTLKVHVTYGAEDPADTGIRYGQAWAIIGAVTPVLENTFTVKKRDLQAIYDPDAEGFTIEAEVKARLFVWQIIAIAVSAGVKILIQFLKMKKGGAKK